MLQSIRNPDGAGFAEYQWPSLEDTSIYRDKITYSQLFTPYGWVIGSGDYPEVLGEKNQAKLLWFSEEGGGAINYDWEKLTGAKVSAKLALVEYVKSYRWIILAGTYDPVLDEQFVTKPKLVHAKAEQQLGLLIITLVFSLLGAVALIFLFGRFYKRAFGRYQLNIESQKQHLQDNAKQLSIAARFFESSAEGVVVTDPEQKIIAVNPACCAMTGYSEIEILGNSPVLFSSGQESDRFYQQMWQAINKIGKWQGEMCNKRKNGELYPQWISIASCCDN